MLSNRKHFSILTAAALAAVLSACGGGGGGSIPSTTNTGNSSGQPTSSQGNANASMVVTIPAKTSTSNHRNPKYISVSTQSMTVSLVASGKTTLLTTANLTPTSPGCSVGAGGSTQCTVSFITTAGSDTFSMSMYDGANGKGNLLSTGQTPVETITAGKANTIDVALDGVPASLSVVLGQGTLPVGTASSTSLTVVAEDADNNVIVGPGGFSSAISLAITGDTYNTLSVSYGAGQSSITSPGQTVTLSYTGGTNVGSTITASTTGATSGSATFAGSGAAVTIVPFSYSGAEYAYGYPYTIAGYPDGSGAAAVYYLEVYQGSYHESYVIGTISASGSEKFFTGPSTALSGFSNVTTVSGMSADLNYEGYYYAPYSEDIGAYDDIAVDSSKNVYYSAENSSSCYVVGKFNPESATPTSTETVVQGNPMYLHLDSSGNLWFIEQSSPCNGASGFSSGWGVGELSSTGTLTERDLGISSIGISDMAVSPDGSTMYIAEYYGGSSGDGAIAKVSTASLAASTLNLTNSLYPDAIAADANGNAAWFTDNEPSENYYYGATTSSFASAAEAPFPVNDFYSYSMTYADGSFWAAGEEYASGFGRISNVGAGAPVASYYQLPTADGDGQEMYSASAAAGIVWGADGDYGNIDLLQYGAAPSGATVTINKVRRLGQQVEPKNTRLPSHTRMPHSAI